MSKPKATRKELRGTGLTVGIALLVVGVAQLIFHGRLSHQPAISILFGCAGLLLVLAIAAPTLLRPFHFVWMKLAEGLGWVMNRVLLGIFFFIFMTLGAIVLRLIRRDVLHRDFKKRSPSYWTARPEAPVAPERYERQF